MKIRVDDEDEAGLVLDAINEERMKQAEEEISVYSYLLIVNHYM